jgi:hypothetical protein
VGLAAQPVLPVSHSLETEKSTQLLQPCGAQKAAHADAQIGLSAAAHTAPHSPRMQRRLVQCPCKCTVNRPEPLETLLGRGTTGNLSHTGSCRAAAYLSLELGLHIVGIAGWGAGVRRGPLIINLISDLATCGRRRAIAAVRIVSSAVALVHIHVGVVDSGLAGPPLLFCCIIRANLISRMAAPDAAQCTRLQHAALLTVRPVPWALIITLTRHRCCAGALERHGGARDRADNVRAVQLRGRACRCGMGRQQIGIGVKQFSFSRDWACNMMN